MSPEEQVGVLTGERNELRAMVIAIVNGVESVTIDNGNALIETRLPKVLFGRMVEVSE